MDTNQRLRAAKRLLDATVPEYEKLQEFLRTRAHALAGIHLQANFVANALTTPGDDALSLLMSEIRVSERLTTARISHIRSQMFDQLYLCSDAPEVIARYETWFRIEDLRRQQESQGVPAALRVKHVNAGKAWSPAEGAVAGLMILGKQGTHWQIGLHTGRTEDSGRSFCVHQAHKDPNSDWTNKELRKPEHLPEQLAGGLLENRLDL